VVVNVTVLVSNKSGHIRQCGKNNLGMDIFCCTNLIAAADQLLQTQAYYWSGRSVVNILNRVQTGRYGIPIPEGSRYFFFLLHFVQTGSGCQLGSRLSMSGDVPSLPLYAVVVFIDLLLPSLESHCKVKSVRNYQSARPHFRRDSDPHQQCRKSLGLFFFAYFNKI
jgi:hypothetical protein